MSEVLETVTYDQNSQGDILFFNDAEVHIPNIEGFKVSLFPSPDLTHRSVLALTGILPKSIAFYKMAARKMIEDSGKNVEFTFHSGEGAIIGDQEVEGKLVHKEISDRKLAYNMFTGTEGANGKYVGCVIEIVEPPSLFIFFANSARNNLSNEE